MTPAVLLAAGVAVAAVALGLLLGLGSTGGSRVVGPLRTFAFAAALGVALTHLLPEAFAELGAPGLLLFAAASVAPAWGELVRRVTRRESHGAHGGALLGAGYAGLLVHHVGDGLGLGAYSELPGGPTAHADVLVALAVHTVPLVAVVTLAFRTQRGVRTAVERALGLAAASVGGVLLSGSVPENITRAWSAWIAAGVAGLLMHVVTHDLGRDLPSSLGARAVDWLAAAAGIATSTLGAEASLVALRHAMLREFSTGFAVAAPGLVLGIAAALLLTRIKSADLARWLAPLPGPARGLDGAFVGAAFVGIRFGILFWLGTALSARIASLFTGHPHEHASHVDLHAHAGAPGNARHDAHADAHADAHSDSHPGVPTLGPKPLLPPGISAPLREIAAWTLTALVLYALFVASLLPRALASLTAPLALGAAALCGLAVQLPAPAAVIIAVAVWDRGLRPDAALAFALIASARVHTRLAPLAVTLVICLVAGFAALGLPLARLPLPFAVTVTATALVALVFVLAAWKHGIRSLFAAVFHSHDTA